MSLHDARFSSLKVESLVCDGLLTVRELQADNIKTKSFIGEQKFINHITVDNVDTNQETVYQLVTKELTVAGDFTTHDVAFISESLTIENGGDTNPGDVWTCTSPSGTGSWQPPNAENLTQIKPITLGETIDMSTFPNGCVIQLNIPDASTATLDFPLSDERPQCYWKIIGGTSPGGTATVNLQLNGQHYTSIINNFFSGPKIMKNVTVLDTGTTGDGRGSCINLDVFRRFLDSDGYIYITGNAFRSSPPL